MAKKAQPPEPSALDADLGRIMRQATASEEIDAHAGLLLFALIRPEKRGPYHVAQALGVPRSKPRAWCVRWCWRERTARVGRDADRQAAMIYRQLYAEDPLFGRAPLDRIANMIGPEAWLLLGVGPPVLQVEAGIVDDPASADDPDAELSASPKENVNPGLDAIRTKVRSQADAAQKAHLDALAAKAEREREAREEQERLLGFYRRSQGLTEALVGIIAKQVAVAANDPTKVDIRPRDLGKLLEQHRELSELLGVIQPPSQAQGNLEPSYRVQLAITTGGDVLAAMAADVEECQVIIGAMQARRSAALATPAADPSAADGAAVEPPGAQDEASPGAS